MFPNVERIGGSTDVIGLQRPRDEGEGGPVGRGIIWRFGPMHAPVLVRGAEPLLPHLSTFLAGWPSEPADDMCGPVDIDVVAVATGFLVRTRGAFAGEAAFTDAFGAANGLAGILAGAYVCADTDALCLHAGAVEMDEGAVLVLGDSMAGKSSVSLHLAAAGFRFLGDDRIGVRARAGDGQRAEAICLGLLPKVRLPVPADAGLAFGTFVGMHTVLEWAGAAYLGATIPEAARFGDRAPVRAIVLLDRQAAVSARLEQVTAAELARTVIRRAYAPHLSGDGLVRAAARMARSLAAMRLTFASSAEAAKAIEENFSRGTR